MINGDCNRTKLQEIELNSDLPNEPDDAISSLFKAANQLIEMSTSSAKRKPEETESIEG